MKPAELELRYGMNADGRLVPVADVPRGLACGCRCAECGKRLVARKGNVIRHHFAHEADAACAKALETTAHLLAKQIIADAGWLVVPALQASAKGVASRIAEERRRVTFTQVEVERGCDGFRPDLMAFEGETKTAIEVLVTHACPQEKVDLLKARRQTTLEIDLSRYRRGLPDDPAVFADAVLSSAPRKWIFHSRQAAANEQLRRDARAEIAKREEMLRKCAELKREMEESLRRDREAAEAKERAFAALSVRELRHNLSYVARGHFGRDDLARLWLKTPNPMLGRIPPIALCENVETYRRCESVLDHLYFEHVRIQSRQDDPDELQDMARLLSSLSRGLRWRIWSMFCDSKQCASYTVEMRRSCDTVEQARPVANELKRLLMEQHGGFNWLEVGPIEMDCSWEEDPMYAEILAASASEPNVQVSPVLGTLAITQADSTTVPPWQRIRAQLAVGMSPTWEAAAD